MSLKLGSYLGEELFPDMTGKPKNRFLTQMFLCLRPQLVDPVRIKTKRWLCDWLWLSLEVELWGVIQSDINPLEDF
jgi:hypothetical protein